VHAQVEPQRPHDALHFPLGGVHPLQVAVHPAGGIKDGRRWHETRFAADQAQEIESD
jgi:hypothetical protein